MKLNTPRIMIAATASGSGKTTIVCALLRAFTRRALNTVSFKCGPDYIDPMFHRETVGTSASYNLDLFFANEATVQRIAAVKTENADIAVMEGVMGFYDGIACTDEASAYALAKTTKTPVILIINCRGLAFSAVAHVKGFQSLRSDCGISAVLLNNVSEAFYPEMKTLIEHECEIPVVGFFPIIKDCTLESRHLGLVTAAEVVSLQEKLDALADQAERSIDLDKILSIAKSAISFDICDDVQSAELKPVTVAVAHDKAFCFYYEETLELLRSMGAQTIFFSPIDDEELPENACGLLLGGGYPELYAKRLSENISMRESIRKAINSGMPTIAECGGFLYLHKTLDGSDGTTYPMANVINARAFRTNKLSRFGYVELEAESENMLCSAGEHLRAHEFHYWDSEDSGDGFTAKKPYRQANWKCVHTGKNLYAGFPHLYLAGNPNASQRFLDAVALYTKSKGVLL